MTRAFFSGPSLISSLPCSYMIDYDTIFKDCFFTKKVVLFSIKTFLFMYESLTTIYDTTKSKKG